MKLVYSNRRFNQLTEIHRFDAIGEIHSNDLAVLHESISKLIHRISRDQDSSVALILDLSEALFLTSTSELESFKTGLLCIANSMNISMIIAIDLMDSSIAETRVIEDILGNTIHKIESKLALMDSVRNQVTQLQNENSELKNRLRIEKESSPSRPKSLYERLWGDT